jgi:hypothetical protein
MQYSFTSNFTFHIGDRVLSADIRNPECLQEGIIRHVIPNRDGIDSLVQYVIDFGTECRVLFENELELVVYAKSA